MTPSESRLNDVLQCLDRLIAMHDKVGTPSSPLDMALTSEVVQQIREMMAMEEADPIYSALFPEQWGRLRERMHLALSIFEVRH